MLHAYELCYKFNNRVSREVELNTLSDLETYTQYAITSSSLPKIKIFNIIWHNMHNICVYSHSSVLQLKSDCYYESYSYSYSVKL